jgi:hypothetical protein
MASIGSLESLDCVEASLLYLVSADQVSGSAVCTNGSDWPGTSAFYPMPVYDARPIAQNLSLDLQGFILLREPTAVGNFYDSQEVRTVYYLEVESLVRRATGAAKVVVFAHDVRCAYRAKAREAGIREPVTEVHNDYTPRSGPQMVRESLDPAEAQRRLMSRFAEVNVWRPIQGPVRSTPLAVCDARSIQQQDLVKTELKHEVYMVVHSASHRWFYFPRMQRDEVVILKCFDSAEDGRAQFTVHAAFEDPTTPPGAPARESIEVRALAFFSD